ncbi:hypothetical protein RND71_007515 [Anisodus tanguticus]|uniref:J domain-containing protein n=1 Tax=Anisodus tanguticus TaxID=243964 RepID=A0AAE1VPU3_9SOLA|nr:hypothetical protein RND71_007515 [Anisodus tanguticus]
MFGRAPKRSDNSKYYEVLGVSKSASQDELKKAYRKAAIRNHPDKGGDPEKWWLGQFAHCILFKVVPPQAVNKIEELAQSYEVLSDPEKREIYYQNGEDALKEGMGSGSGLTITFDIFESFFGGSFGGGCSRFQTSRQKQGEDVVHTLGVSLEDLNNGTTKKLTFPEYIVSQV